jgi:hypothetical protein
MRLFLTLLLCFKAFLINAQTCCSGGIPLANNVGFTTQSPGTLLASFNYEHNYLNNLLSENNTLAENNRKRVTNSFLFRMGYTFSQKWSIESLVPYIIQKREILQNSGALDREQSEGIGDIVLMIKYDVLQLQKWNINVGIGPKFATADSDKTNSAGLLLIKDLQPGTGAMDLISRIAISHTPDFRPSTTLFLSGIYSLKTTDNTYLGSQTYKFGNDLQFILGISDQLFIKDKPIYPSIGLRSRNAARDKISEISLPNTGGKWLFLRTNLGIDLSKNIRFISAFEWPIFAYVDGTQLSPTSIFNIGILGNLSIKSQKEIILP